MAQGERLDGGDALDDGGVEREQRLVVEGHQEPELRVSLELKFCQSSFAIYHLLCLFVENQESFDLTLVDNARFLPIG